MSIALATMLQVSILASAPTNYNDALEESLETGRPLVVLVGTDWCPGCKRMKNSVIPQLRASGVLQKVCFAMVDADEKPALARKLTDSTAIPQLVVYRKTARGWQRTKIVGAKPAETVAAFIQRAVDTSSVAVARDGVDRNALQTN